MTMERLPEFRLARPASYAEAAALLAGEPAARLVAGGTDLVPNLRRGIERPPLLVDLGAVAGRAEMDFDAAGLR
ncbi:MAG: FAD binding domain-containing protein, partial [Burkholderiales bacterium]|nr:FAD binding domain-containing protein [Burkholderiales bacterium]